MKHSRADALRRYQGLVGKYHETLDLMSSAALADFDAKVGDALAYAKAITGRGLARGRILVFRIE